MGRHSAIQIISQAALSGSTFLIPVFAASLGANAVEIGLIGAVYGLAQFSSSFLSGRAADAYGRKRMLQLGLGLSACAALVHVLATTPVALVFARAAFGFAAGMFPAALVSLAYDENRKLGRFTSWGSLGFGLGSLAGGLIGAFVGVFLFSALLLTAAYLMTYTLHYPPDHRVSVPVFPVEVIVRNLPVYAAVIVRHVGASAVWIVLPLYLASMGASLFAIGAVNAVNALCQFLFMPLTDRFRSTHLVVAGLVLSAATFAALLAARDVWQVVLVQPLLAASWAALYMGALKFVMERNAERTTATGLLQSSIQMSSVVGPVAGGLIAAAFGIRATMVAAIALALVAVPLFRWELRRHPATPIDAFGKPTKAMRRAKGRSSHAAAVARKATDASR